MTNAYLPILFVACIAFLAPFLSQRVTRGIVPTVVIEILLGILVGPGGLNWLHSNQTLAFLAGFGFTYLMFLSGVELDFEMVLSSSKGETPLWRDGLIFFLAVAAVTALIVFPLAAAHVLTHPYFFLGLICTTSMGIVVPALKESRWLSHPLGQRILGVALALDFFPLLYLAGYTSIRASGQARSLLLVIFLFLAMALIYRFAQQFQNHAFVQLLKKSETEFSVRGAFALILLFVALAQGLGTQVVLGAFLAGVVVSLLVKKHSVFTQKINSIGYGFFLPFFFVNVGLTFQFSTAKHSWHFWVILLVLFLAMYLTKFLPSAFLLRMIPMKQRIGVGALLGSQLSLMLLASKLGQQLGVLSADMANGLILLAIISCIVSPPIFSRLVGHNKEALPIEQETSLSLDLLPENWTAQHIEIRNRRYAGRRVASLQLPRDVLIVSVKRNDEILVPRGTTRLERFDTLQVIGDTTVIEAVRLMLSGETLSFRPSTSRQK
ncbi:cation:proton antiporter [Ferroacidibacillus organovorans]|uniref:RCK C-terminal domain-containing protein n=1 Tax=Ferroacidibacillus organovorans TaxID=1765683 RepID=A0A101XT65_9BACL|nr:cation:proton antiporter [Ferroacidibacillus organovorans]KUO97119.1 hypothetical protein ATW55_12485 [Ferroacidibacillus organovorans]